MTNILKRVSSLYFFETFTSYILGHDVYAEFYRTMIFK